MNVPHSNLLLPAELSITDMCYFVCTHWATISCFFEEIREKKITLTWLYPTPTAAIDPLMKGVSIEARPLQYAAKIICSAVKHSSAYAHPNSPTLWPVIKVFAFSGDDGRPKKKRKWTNGVKKDHIGCAARYPLTISPTEWSGGRRQERQTRAWDGNNNCAW